MLDLTDTFCAFHRVVAVLWREFGPVLAEAPGTEDMASFDELVDQLELDLFLPACARRLQRATGEVADPDEIAARIRLVRESGEPLTGAGAQYHSHAFHPGSLQDDVPIAVLAANLMSLPLPGIRLVLGEVEGQPRPALRRDLPVH